MLVFNSIKLESILVWATFFAESRENGICILFESMVCAHTCIDRFCTRKNKKTLLIVLIDINKNNELTKIAFTKLSYDFDKSNICLTK